MHGQMPSVLQGKAMYMPENIIHLVRTMPNFLNGLMVIRIMTTESGGLLRSMETKSELPMGTTILS